jgi:hypothetical protein
MEGAKREQRPAPAPVDWETALSNVSGLSREQRQAANEAKAEFYAWRPTMPDGQTGVPCPSCQCRRWENGRPRIDAWCCTNCGRPHNISDAEWQAARPKPVEAPAPIPSPPPTPAELRAALALAIEAERTAQAELAALQTAIPLAREQIMHAEAVRDTAAAVLEQARTGAATRAVATALGEARPEPISLGAARAALADAEDGLEAARAARSQLQPDLEAARTSAASGERKVRAAALAVLAGESVPALIEQGEAAAAAFIVVAARLKWLRQQQALPDALRLEAAALLRLCDTVPAHWPGVAETSNFDATLRALMADATAPA